MKNVEDIKVKQFAIAVKKNTLKRGINLKTESLQERDDEKADARGNPQRYAMSQISNKSKKAAIRGIQAVAFSEERRKHLKEPRLRNYILKAAVRSRMRKISMNHLLALDIVKLCDIIMTLLRTEDHPLCRPKI